jgi:hypothetical protein
MKPEPKGKPEMKLLHEIETKQCPPAIAQGAECNPITREHVAKLRREFFREHGYNHPDRPYKRGPGRPKGSKKPVAQKPTLQEIEAKKIADKVERIRKHAVKYYPKKEGQRRWDIIVEAWTDKEIEDYLRKENFVYSTMREVIKDFDRLLDLLGEQEEGF